MKKKTTNTPVFYKKVSRYSLYLVLTLLSSLYTPKSYAKSLTSDIPYREIERQVKIITNKYRALEDLFKNIKYYSTRSLPRTALNVSFLKNRDIKYFIRHIELSLNGTPVYGHIYNDNENRSFELGGRQMLYDGDVSEGEHLVSVKAVLQPKKSKSGVLTKSNIVKIQVGGDMVFFLEVTLSSDNGETYLEIEQISQQGVLGIIE